jgi:hypothetical protein
MTLPGDGRKSPREVTTDLREARAVARESGAVLVPVEGGGEPIPAEEPPAPARPKEF